MTCTFPTCTQVATTANRAGQAVCPSHVPVVVASNGSDVNDRHLEGGHG